MLNKGSNLRTRVLGTIAVLAALALGASPANARHFETQQFLDDEMRPLALALLPPQAELIEQRAVFSEELVAEARAFEESMTKWIQTQLENKGYAVKILTAEEINADPEVQKLVYAVNSRYDEEREKLRKRPWDLEKHRYGCGDDLRVLADVLDVDAIVMARMTAAGAAPGRVALSVFGAWSSGAHLDVAVVDADTGDVEAFFDADVWGTGKKQVMEKGDKLVATLTHQALTDVPAVTEEQRLAYAERDAGQREQVLTKELEWLLEDEEPTELEWMPEPEEPQAEEDPSN